MIYTPGVVKFQVGFSEMENSVPLMSQLYEVAKLLLLLKSTLNGAQPMGFDVKLATVAGN
jgi:hypothetical protein